ncbi:2931_t:CDS:2, partial [Racocetra fulgida]
DVDFSPPESHADYEEVWEEDCEQYYDEYDHFDVSTEPDHSDHGEEWLDTPTPFDMTEEESLANLISVQKRLQKFSWTGGYEDLSPITLSFSSQQENLIEVQLENAFFRDSAALEGLAPCQNLETLKIAECQLTAANLRPLVYVTFPRLQVLEITDVRDIYYLDDHEDTTPPSNELTAIIRRTNGTLREIRLNLELHFYPNIIDTIAECCPNLKLLAASIKDDEQIPELLRLLSSCRQLESLIIHGYNSNFFTADYILPQIGAIVPETLRYLDLTNDEYTAAIESYAQEKELEVENLQVDYRDSGF